jgi:outer membrane murein-binding lipoprotein Lpp
MLRLLGISLFALLLTGCASSAKVDSMVSNASASATFDSGLQHNIVVDQVLGGEETTATTRSKISNTDFQAALVQSLRNNGLLGGTAPRYGLRAKLIDLQQPVLVVDANVGLTVVYSLVEHSSGREVWEDTVQSSGTAGFTDAYLGVTLVRLATEDAARKNIQIMIQHLSALHGLSNR